MYCLNIHKTRTMRIYLTSMLILCCLGLSARQSGRITISFHRTSLDTAFRMLEAKTGWHISFETSRTKGIMVPARTFRDAEPDVILSSLLAGTPLGFKRQGNSVLIIPRPVSKTLSGFVSDAVSGERLPGVVLAVPDFRQGTVSNTFGYYSLTLPADSLRLQIQFMGYRRLDTMLLLQPDTRLNFALEPMSQVLGEVTVKGSKNESIEQSSQMSRISIPIAMVGSTPRILGEKDLFKTLQMLPGVKQGTEGTSALLVRGGTPDQNLILLDGAPLYNPMHLMGIFSTFNTAALKDVTLYKGAFPARYGGRLSSVVDITTKDGNLQKMHGEAGIGLLAASISLEGPLKKDKTSFIVSGRRSYPDLIATPFVKKGDEAPEKFKLNFYDINAKLHHRISEKDQLYLSIYSGRDHMRFRFREKKDRNSSNDYSITDANVAWGNHTGTLRWSHVYSPKLFSNAMLIGSRYRLKINNYLEDKYNGETNTNRQMLQSGIEDYGGKIDFDYRPNPAHSIRFGASSMYRIFTPGIVSQKQTDNGALVMDSANSNQRIKGTELDVYAEDDWEITPRFKANIGLHWSGFAVHGRFYQSLQPRTSMRYLLPGNWALKASWSRMTQYIHLLANNTLSLPTDLWVPATARIRPQQADQFALGVAKNLWKGKLEFTAEAYYKNMRNIIEYKDGAGYLTTGLSDGWQEHVAAGKGEAYGMELLLKKTTGRLTGWIGYTLSWSNRQIKEVSNGQTFPYKYDRRHDLHILLNYKLRKGIEVYSSWTYQSPMPFTVSVGRYEQVQTPGHGGIEQIAGRNNIRLVPYHRLDVGINFIKHRKNGTIRTWNISLLNAYNHFNPSFVVQNYNGAAEGKLAVRSVNVMPFMPSVSYQLTF